MQPKVIISLLNWNNFQDTIKCITSLLHLNYQNFEIFVIDNGSINNSVGEIKTIFPKIEIIQSKENLGYAGGHELTVKKAFERKAELVWIINNDLETEKDSLQNLVNAYLTNKSAIYGSLVLSDRENQIIEQYSNSDITGKSLKNVKINLIEEINYVAGSSILIPMEVIKQYGFIDTSFFLYGEEVDFCYRLRKKGILSYIVGNSIAYHSSSGSFKFSNKLKYIKSYYNTRNTLYYLFNHHNYSKNQIIKIKGGIIRILFNLLKGIWDKQEKYYEHLGVIHFLLGIKGKTLSPEDFLK